MAKLKINKKHGILIDTKTISSSLVSNLNTFYYIRTIIVAAVIAKP